MIRNRVAGDIKKVLTYDWSTDSLVCNGELIARDGSQLGCCLD